MVDNRYYYFRVSGTPTEDMWPGVSNLPNYKPYKLCYYKVKF